MAYGHNPIDYFNSPQFSVRALTDAVNVVPNRYGRLNELNLFPADGIRTTFVEIEFQNGVLNLVPLKKRGEPAAKNVAANRGLKVFRTFHFPLEDAILVSDLTNVRAFGTDDQMVGVMDEVNDLLAEMRAKHAITLEYYRWGALKGEILDESGNSVVNLFTEFGVAQKTVDFVLGTAGTNVEAKITEVLEHIEDNLMGETMSGVHALVSSEFFAKFTAHEQVREAYRYFSSTADPMRQDVRRSFFHKGITFEVHRGSATKVNEDKTTTLRRFIAANEGVAFPLGTTNSFKTYFSPGDFIEALGTRGQEVYAKQEVMKYGRGVDLWTESNPLPICKRPALLVKIHSSN
jgi:hypothetical protein